jgi:mRNA interferase RelE/StbE
MLLHQAGRFKPKLGHHLKNCHNIKPRCSGFRLLYEVIDDILMVAIVAAGTRDRKEVYQLASNRLR